MMSPERVAAIAAAALASGACVFELPPLSEGSAGGAGGTGGDGASGGAGASTAGYEVIISYDGRQVPSTQTEVPLLVRFDPSRFDYGLADDDGADLRFFAEGDDVLPHEIERWDPTGTSLVWVRLPTMAPSGGTFLMRFGTPPPPSPPSPSEVWSRYEGVYHFAETTGGIARDSASGLDGLATDVVATEGPIGEGLAFDGVASEIIVGDVASFDVPPGQARSFSVWFQRGTTEAVGMTLGRTRNDCCDGWRTILLGDPYANLRHDVTIGSCCAGEASDFFTTPIGLPGGQGDVDWHRVTAVMDRLTGMTTVYRDGIEIDTSPLGTAGDMAGRDVAFGVGPDGGNRFVGALDEARVGSEAFSADWVALTYRIAREDLLDFGTAQPAGDR